MFLLFFIGGYVVYVYSIKDLIMYYILLLGCMHNDKFAICFAVISNQRMCFGIYMHCFMQNEIYVQNHNFL